MKGGRLSRPKHCSKGAQPVLKTVHHSSRRDKHNCQRRDSNLDPLTPQSDALTTRLLVVVGMYYNYNRIKLLQFRVHISAELLSMSKKVIYLFN